MGWRLEDVELSQDTVVISLFFPPGLEDRRDKRCAVYVEVRTESAETVQMTPVSYTHLTLPTIVGV